MDTTTADTGELVQLAATRAQACRLSEIAEHALAGVSALEMFCHSPYFSVDTAAAGVYAQRIESLMDQIEDARKSLDKFEVLHIYRMAEELYNFTDEAIRASDG